MIKSYSDVTRQLHNLGYNVEPRLVKEYLTGTGVYNKPHTKAQTINYFSSGNWKPMYDAPVEKEIKKVLSVGTPLQQKYVNDLISTDNYKKLIASYKQGKRMTPFAIRKLSSLEAFAGAVDKNNNTWKDRMKKGYRAHVLSEIKSTPKGIELQNKILESIDNLSLFYDPTQVNIIFSYFNQLGISDDESQIISPSEAQLRYLIEVLGIDYDTYADEIKPD